MSKKNLRNFCPLCGGVKIRKTKQGKYRKCLDCSETMSLTTFNKKHRAIEDTPPIVIHKGSQPGMPDGATTPEVDLKAFTNTQLAEPYRPESALDTQVGGGHYKSHAIQPVEFIHKNSIGFIEGNCIKYLMRHRDKNGVEDLKKVKHYVDLLIELEYGVQSEDN